MTEKEGNSLSVYFIFLDNCVVYITTASSVATMNSGRIMNDGNSGIAHVPVI